MKINLVAVGTRLPEWIENGVATYLKRLQSDCQFRLIEVKSSSIEQEGEQLLAAIPKNHYIIALDERGQEWSSIELAATLENWQQEGYDVSLIIGGADGLALKCKQKANKIWSLSKLTLPHGLVRVLVIEQLYRAFSILKSHPYHRA